MIRKLFLLLVFGAIAAGTAVTFIYLRTQQAYRGFEGEEQFVDVPPGSSTTTSSRCFPRSSIPTATSACCACSLCPA